MRIALGQMNSTVGDFDGNRQRMVEMAQQAASAGAEVVVFPELAITGYPPRDLVEKPSFLVRSVAALAELAAATASLPLAVITGYVGPAHISAGKRVTNSAAVLAQGQVLCREDKMLLPTYDVFDEARYFQPGERQQSFCYRGQKLALTICEDAWNDKQFWERRLYDRDPVEEMMQERPSALLTINASPYHQHKRKLRQDIFSAAAKRYRTPVVYVNQVGGNDQLVFDGSSFVMSAAGEMIASAPSFREDLICADIETNTGDLRADYPDETEAVYEALVLGTRDYLHKCGFRQVLIGLSGGIDSALVAVIAVSALGKENVIGVGMPGPYSSDHSLRDAREMAERLGIRFEVANINRAYDAFLQEMAPIFAGYAQDVTEENVQSRLRGLTLMSMSNKFGALVLTTGNKSELAVGYCTLYGDMCGGLAVISDVPKTLVYQLCRVGNRRHNDAIPESVFTKPPSAELRPDQKDTDSLPDYDVLDAILQAYVEEYRPAAAIAEELKLPLALVRDIARKVDRNEYKRQQAAPGLKVTTKAFGIGRRMPIAQRFSDE